MFASGGISPPAVCLPMFEWGVRVGPRLRALGWLVPTIELEFREMVEAQPVKLRAASIGVGIHAHIPGMPIVFWSRDTAAILEQLEQSGVTVSRETTDAQFFDKS
jgi:hypothetical protein